VIHYHGGPLSGPKDSFTRFFRGRHAMVSYAYPDALPAVADVCQSFALDNGAFTTWKSGREFDTDAYAAWVEEWHTHPAFDWCLIPDKIDGTWTDNWDAVCRWKTTSPTCDFRSVPVWHLHEPLEYLHLLARTNPTVALGSSGQWATPGTDAWWERMGGAMRTICDQRGRPNLGSRLHGLRMLDPAIFTRLPLASADSTNAAVNAGSVSRFGSYPAPEPWQRANAIADRIEAFSSSPVWRATEKQSDLFLYCGATP